MTVNPAPLTAAQERALRDYAEANGPKWKDKLRTDWMNASASPVLHRLRNTHGPSWLTGYQLPSASGLARSSTEKSGGS